MTVPDTTCEDLLPSTFFATLVNAYCSSILLAETSPPNPTLYLVVGKTTGEVVFFPTTNREQCVSKFENEDRPSTISALAAGDLRNVGKTELVGIQSNGLLLSLNFPTPTGAEDTTPSTEVRTALLNFSQLIYANICSAEVLDVDNDGFCELLVVMTDRVVRSYRFLTDAGRLSPLNKWEVPVHISGWSLGYLNAEMGEMNAAMPCCAFLSQLDEPDYICVEFGPGKDVHVARTATTTVPEEANGCQLVLPRKTKFAHLLNCLVDRVVVVDGGNRAEISLGGEVISVSIVELPSMNLTLLLTVDLFGHVLIHGWQSHSAGAEVERPISTQPLAKCELTMRDVCHMSAYPSPTHQHSIIIALVNVQNKLSLVSIDLSPIRSRARN